MEKKYRYLGFFMMALIPLTFFAFYKSYFKDFPAFSGKIHTYDHVHATIALTWILMLIVQPILIKNRNYELHRKIGRVSYFIFPLMILSFIPREILLYHSDARKDLFFPVGDTVILIPLYVLAMMNRRNTPRHMRFIISSALVLMGPLIGRIGPQWFGWDGFSTQNLQYGIIYAVLISLIIYDRNLKKSQPYFIAFVFFFFHQTTFYLLYL